MDIEQAQNNFLSMFDVYKKDLSINRQNLYEELDILASRIELHVNGLIKYTNFDPLDEMNKDFLIAITEFQFIKKLNKDPNGN